MSKAETDVIASQNHTIEFTVRKACTGSVQVLFRTPSPIRQQAEYGQNTVSPPSFTLEEGHENRVEQIQSFAPQVSSTNLCSFFAKCILGIISKYIFQMLAYAPWESAENHWLFRSFSYCRSVNNSTEIAVPSPDLLFYPKMNVDKWNNVFIHSLISSKRSMRLTGAEDKQR